MTVFIDNPTKEKEATAFLQDFESEDGFKVKCTIENRIPRGENQGPVLFLSLPKIEDELKMTPFFKSLEVKKTDLGIGDFSVGLSTLEEVFLELSKRDHFIPGKTEVKEVMQVNLKGMEGVQVGMVIEAKDRFGRPQKVTLSEKDVEVGFVNLEIVVPQEAQGPSTVKVDVKNSNAKDVSIQAQAQALIFKTLQWQRRHKAQLFSNICFPVFIMILLLILDQLVFGLLREAALCGQGIKYSECKEKGINLTCAGAAFERVSDFKTPLPAPYVGEVQAWGQGGVGINPNCGQDMNGGRTCFHGLEKPQYHGIYSKSTSSRTLTVSKDLTNFYNRFRTLVASSTCKDEFERSMSCRPTRRGNDWYCTGREREVRECQKECNSVVKVKDKVESQDESRVAQSENPLAKCIPSDESRRRLIAKKSRKLVALTEKEQEYYDIYLKKLETKEKCDKTFLLKLA